MEIIFQTKPGERIPVTFLSRETVSEAKCKLETIMKCHKSDFVLYYNNRKLEDNLTFEQIGYVPGTIISAKLLNMPRHVLPPRGGQNELLDPPDFDKKLESLIEMGFIRQQCEKALRAAFYNVDRAAEYLIENKIPEYSPSFLPEIEQRKQEFVVNNNSNDIERQTIDVNERELSPDERSALSRLYDQFRRNLDKSTILQVFYATDKKETLAADCLKNMKE